MNKTFDFKRFGKYFSYDLLSSWRKAGVSVIVTALLPLWFFFIYELICLVFTGYFRPFNHGNLPAYFISFAVTAIMFPSRVYGHLTKKKAGSDWILLPASTMEKYVSMILVTCVVLPIVWFATICACDFALSSFFVDYGPFAAFKPFRIMDKLFENISTDVPFIFNGLSTIYISWVCNILTFTLGAIFFRKNKVVYTFLALFAIGLVFTIGLGIVADHSTALTVSGEDIMNSLNTGSVIIYCVEISLLLFGIFCRIKTLKH